MGELAVARRDSVFSASDKGVFVMSHFDIPSKIRMFTPLAAYPMG